MIKRSVIFNELMLEPDSFKLTNNADYLELPSFSEKITYKTLDKEIIKHFLKLCDYNVSKTIRFSELSLVRLKSKLKEYGIDVNKLRKENKQ